jgi:hypothetical protein
MNKSNLPPEVYEFFKRIGHLNGTKLFKERGSEYFSKISKMRKHFRGGRPSKESPKATSLDEA